MPATIFAQFAKKSPAPMALGLPGRYLDCQKSAGVISGPAPIAEMPQKPDGVLPMLIKLETLLAQAKHARNLRQSKVASEYEAAIRAQRLAIWRVER